MRILFKIKYILRFIKIKLWMWKYKFFDVQRIGRNSLIEPYVHFEGGKIDDYGHRGIVIGSNCRIYAYNQLVTDTFIKKGGIYIGNNVGINYGGYFGGSGGIKIGDNVLIGPKVLILSSGHEFSNFKKPVNQQPLKFGEVIIENDVWLGGGVIILPGVKIGRGCVIGAGAVVTKSLQEYAVVVGNPAKIVKFRQRNK